MYLQVLKEAEGETALKNASSDPKSNSRKQLECERSSQIICFGQV